MDKQKQIEEMAKTYCQNGFKCGDNCQTNGCRVYEVCTELYNAGYRKISENVVVISRAEYNDLKGLEKHFDDYLIKEIVETRKETAEKFAEKVSKAFIGLNCIDIDEWNWCQKKIDEICKEIIGGVRCDT